MPSDSRMNRAAPMPSARSSVSTSPVRSTMVNAPEVAGRDPMSAEQAAASASTWLAICGAGRLTDTPTTRQARSIAALPAMKPASEAPDPTGRTMVARVGSTPWSSSCARTSKAADANPRAPTGVAPPLGTGYGCRPSSSKSITRFAIASSMSARSPPVARTTAPQARARRIGTVDAGPSATSTSQSSPATADACAQAPAKLEVGAPPVTTMSQP